MAWSIKILEYEIFYKPRENARAQVLADFINELHPPQPHLEQEWWTMHEDDSSNQHGSGAMVIL